MSFLISISFDKNRYAFFLVEYSFYCTVKYQTSIRKFIKSHCVIDLSMDNDFKKQIKDNETTTQLI